MRGRRRQRSLLSRGISSVAAMPVRIVAAPIQAAEAALEGLLDDSDPDVNIGDALEDLADMIENDDE